MSKHTEGPWKLVKTTSHYSIQASDSYSLQVARVTGSNGENNARLIAAAPEMLDGLKLALQLLVEHQVKNYSNFDDLRDGVADRIERILDKAEGNEISLT